MIASVCSERSLMATLLAGAVFASASVASAHAPPYATDIRWIAGPDGERALVRTNRGLIVEDPLSGAFHLVCNDAFDAALSEVVPLADLADGSVLVGTFAAGLLRADPSLCDFAPVGPSGISPLGLQAVGDGAPRALLLPVDGSEGALFESADQGETFDVLSTFSAGTPTSFAAAPSRPERIYVTRTDYQSDPQVTHLLVSDDGGSRFDEYPLELDASELRAFVVAVDPDDAEHLYVRTQNRFLDGPERLLRSEDGGKSFVAVLTDVGPLSVALDGKGNVWAGTFTALLHSGDGGTKFRDMGSELIRVSCLTFHAGELYACGHKQAEFGVLVSDDEGASFDWFLRFPYVSSRPSCPASSDEVTRCDVAFADWAAEHNAMPNPVDAGQPSAAVPDAAAPDEGAHDHAGHDAGAPEAAVVTAKKDSDSGCACALGPTRRESPAHSLPHWLALLLTFWLRRRTSRG